MFACIYVPNFPVAAALRAEPELRTQPVAVFEGEPPLEKVLAVNQKASSMGITPGMTKAQAELCTELILRPRSALQESAAHAALLDCAQSFSPRVEDSACDTALLDLSGTESLFGPLPEIARALHHGACTLGLEAHVATASNPDAAMLAARGFSGVTVIPSGKEAERLGSLPVEVLFAGSPRNTEKEGASRKKNLTVSWKRSTDGASAISALWPRCPKLRSASASAKPACICNNSRRACLRARWFPWKLR